jgi:hypothetical protein
VPLAILGVAVHPYGYTTNDSNYWLHWQDLFNNHLASPCNDLYQMLNTWISIFSSMPVAMTEVNFCSTCEQGTGTPAWDKYERDANDGAYLIDIFTWLHDLSESNLSNLDSVTESPLRVMWYRASDDIPANNDNLGLFTYQDLLGGPGASKLINTYFMTLPNDANYGYGAPFAYCPNPYMTGLNYATAGTLSLQTIYVAMVRYHSCY